MSMFKLSLVALDALAQNRATTRPVPHPDPRELVEPMNEINKQKFGLLWVAPYLKYSYWVFSVAEAAYTLAMCYPSYKISQYVLSLLTFSGASSGMFSTEPTTPFIIGSILVILQGLIRDQCYRALGRLYTFEFTFRKDHKLITTGPYSIVRHPAYSAGIIGIIGMLLCQFSHGTWMRESGVLGTPLGKVGVGVWIFFEIVRRSVAIARASREDEALKKVFGNVWIEWSKKVKYLIVPGIY